MMTSDEYKHLYERSSVHFEARPTNSRFPDYSEKDHKDYCNRYNSGITHFGITPERLDIENMFIDIFHLRSGITRKMLHYLRHIIDGMHISVQKVFFSYFTNLWDNNKYFLSQFHNNKPLLRVQGKHVLAWIKDMPTFLGLIDIHLEETVEITAFLNACKEWKKISEFMNMVAIENVDEYKQKLTSFKDNVVKFYERT